MPDLGPALTTEGEKLLRNVRSPFVDHKGEVSSQAFEPGPSDEGLLSVDREDRTSPKKCFELFLSRGGANSTGVLAVTVSECTAVELASLENPLDDNPAHCVIDFRSHNRSQGKKRAKLLRTYAVARGWLHGPK